MYKYIYGTYKAIFFRRAYISFFANIIALQHPNVRTCRVYLTHTHVYIYIYVAAEHCDCFNVSTRYNTYSHLHSSFSLLLACPARQLFRSTIYVLLLYPSGPWFSHHQRFNRRSLWLSFNEYKVSCV